MLEIVWDTITISKMIIFKKKFRDKSDNNLGFIFMTSDDTP